MLMSKNVNNDVSKDSPITRQLGKSYLLSTRRRTFPIRGGEHEVKCNDVKRFTVNVFTERDRTFTESGQ